MNRSTKYNFYLPQNTDLIDPSDFDYNFEIIDANLITESQTFTDTQKSTARTNIGAASASDLGSKSSASSVTGDDAFSKINALNNKTLWTRVGNGVTTVTLTSVPNSLIAYVYKSGTTNYIPIFVDTDNNGYYRGGQYFGSNSGFAASVLWNKSTMKLDVAQLFENGTDVTSSAIMRVYTK